MMVPYKYGEFDNKQLSEAKEKIKKKIFFLLLIVDPQTCNQFENICVEDAFKNVQTLINGLNELLFYPKEIVFSSSLIESALNEFHNPDFSYDRYRKLLLDAGWEIAKIKEVE